jgi:hypothetical protein
MFVAERFQRIEAHKDLIEVCERIVADILRLTTGTSMCVEMTLDLEIMRPVGSELEATTQRKYAANAKKSKHPVAPLSFVTRNKSALLHFRSAIYSCFQFSVD